MIEVRSKQIYLGITGKLLMTYQITQLSLVDLKFPIEKKVPILFLIENILLSKCFKI